MEEQINVQEELGEVDIQGKAIEDARKEGGQRKK
jgi:hypothetical protein